MFPTVSRTARQVAAILCVGLAALTTGRVACAQGKLDARYVASLAGIPLGKGAWVIEIGEDEFTAAASGRATGIAQLFTSGTGSGGARGQFNGIKLSPTAYAVTIITDRKSDEVRMAMNGGTVRDVAIEPPPPPISDSEYVPVNETHRKNIFDPMSASLLVVPGNGDVLTPDACQRTLPVFDGRMRYDLLLTYKRMDKVKAEKGYEGPALVCTVLFRPVAGYFREKSAIKYLIEQRDMEIWLVPLAGTRVLVPFRVIVPTPIGNAMLDATQFVTVAQTARANPAGPRPKTR